VFTPEERERLREELVAAARADERISGVALTGSAARTALDRWSDIDLAFGVADPATLREALGDWTDRMHREHGAIHHFDVTRGSWVYRVFLLQSTLQVDLAFAPAADFGALSPTFRLLSGTSVDLPQAHPPAVEEMIGLGWLYALHSRSCIERGEVWQAEYMISAVRDQALALAALRHGLPAVQGRGFDALPPAVKASFEGAVVRSIDTYELKRAFRVATERLLSEVRHSDSALAARLEGPLAELSGGRHSFSIRVVAPGDRDAILEVVRAAFSGGGRDGQEEVDIVVKTWGLQAAVDGLELVALDEDSVIGHVLGARGDLGGRGVVAVAPLAVSPLHQKRGVGSALMGELLYRAEASGYPLVVLLGDPAYYGRFGFEPSGPLGISYLPVGEGNPHFQVRRLAGYDPSYRGMFTYCWEGERRTIGDSAAQGRRKI
jgi:predicted N-acetyltransferase YhbS